MGMKILETIVEKTQFEVKVFTMDSSSSEIRITKTFDYHATRDKIGRKNISSQRDGYTGLGCYALNLLKDCKTHKYGPSRRHSKIGEVKNG